jgi:hypothetical protein
MLRDTREIGSALLIFLASLCALVACTAPHKLISARHISCPVRKVEIRDLITQPQREDWIAVCGAQSYACSTREQGRRLVYGCRPLAAPSAPDAGSAAAADASAATPVFTPDSTVEAGAPDASTP